MLLSRVCFEAVKAAKFLDDPEFTYEGFRSGRFNGDRDYSLEASNVFFPVNSAVKRLQALGKIPLASELRAVGEGGEVEISGIRASSVTAVSRPSGKGSYLALPFESGTGASGEGWLSVPNPGGKPFLALVSYEREIPDFGPGDFSYPESGEGEGKDVELADYGLSEAACHAVAEYAKGELFTAYDPDMGSQAMNRAEALFAALPTVDGAPGRKRIRGPSWA